MYYIQTARMLKFFAVLLSTFKDFI